MAVGAVSFAGDTYGRVSKAGILEAGRHVSAEVYSVGREADYYVAHVNFATDGSSVNASIHVTEEAGRRLLETRPASSDRVGSSYGMLEVCYDPSDPHQVVAANGDHYSSSTPRLASAVIAGMGAILLLLGRKQSRSRDAMRIVTALPAGASAASPTGQHAQPPGQKAQPDPTPAASPPSGMPADIREAIRAHAAVEWPDDFAMQRHVVNNQTEAYWRLQALAEIGTGDPVMQAALGHATSEWPDDFEMRLHAAERQVLSARAFLTFGNRLVPTEILEGIRARAVAEWPTDREMQLHTLQTQVEAWIELNA